jgi:hypothetical protein
MTESEESDYVSKRHIMVPNVHSRTADFAYGAGWKIGEKLTEGRVS